MYLAYFLPHSHHTYPLHHWHYIRWPSFTFRHLLLLFSHCFSLRHNKVFKIDFLKFNYAFDHWTDLINWEETGRQIDKVDDKNIYSHHLPPLVCVYSFTRFYFIWKWRNDQREIGHIYCLFITRLSNWKEWKWKYCVWHSGAYGGINLTRLYDLWVQIKYALAHT